MTTIGVCHEVTDVTVARAAEVRNRLAGSRVGVIGCSVFRCVDER